jgi:uncharacterized membrane protein YgcG
MQHRKEVNKVRNALSLLCALCLSGTAVAGNADSLFFLSPQSAAGYSGIGLSKVGEDLPAWVPPVTTASQAKSAANAATKSGSMIAIGESNVGVSVTFSQYPDKILTSATTFSFFKESPTSSLSLADAVDDSGSAIDTLNSHGAPSSVTEATSLNHIRAGTGLRFNIFPILKQYDFLPFPINPFIGADIMLDVSFGSTRIKPDSAFTPDSGMGAFDSTYHQVFLDAGFAVPMGIELFPLKKTDIPVLKDMGISFVYTIYTLYRTVAFPGLTANPYTDYLNNINSGNNSNSSSDNNQGNNSGSSGSSGGGGNNKSNNIPIWTGWSRVSEKGEYRVSLEFML